MAIAARNVTWIGTGPAESGQVLSQQGMAGDASRALFGFVDFSGDGADTDATANWIDGTKTLDFTPRAVVAHRSGGAAAATISAASVSSITNASALITFSAAPASGTDNVRVALMVLK